LPDGGSRLVDHPGADQRGLLQGTGRTPKEEVLFSRSEADAFHTITFALVEAAHEVFLKSRSVLS
jgi:hypothetical protein